MRFSVFIHLSCCLAAVASLRNSRFDDHSEDDNDNSRSSHLYSYVKPEKANCRNRVSSNRHGVQVKLLEKNAKCMPRDTPIALIASKNENIIPQSIIVKRCGGSCLHPYECIPIKQTKLKLPVQTIRNRKASCSLVTIVEDTKCSCGCHKKATSCNKHQIYDSIKCDCVCNNRKHYEKCLEHSNENMKWDNGTCACVCHERKDCTTGTYWVKEMCKCAKMI